MTAVATISGVVLNFIGIDPIKALYCSAVVNSVVAAPQMAVMMVFAVNKRIVGRLTLLLPMLIVKWLWVRDTIASLPTRNRSLQPTYFLLISRTNSLI